MPGIRYPGDTTWQKEFEAEFPYDETQDQLADDGTGRTQGGRDGGDEL